MKKILFVAAMAAVVATGFNSCGSKAPKADLNNDIDTISYAVGLSQSQGLKDYLVRGMGVDTAYIDQFIEGMMDGANAGDDKKKAAYYAGIQIGQQIANQMVKGINYEIFGEDSTKTISMKNLMAGFVSGTLGKEGLMTPEQAQMISRAKIDELKAKQMEKTYGKNRKDGEAYIAKFAKQDGVKAIEKKAGDQGGTIYYRVIKEGTGEVPADSAVVEVKYEGKTIDGKVFDSTEKNGGNPISLNLRQVIPGWTEALSHMPVGSVWEVVIPQDKAYGAREQREIKPFSTLIFKIELISIKK
ncbi:MAG: FKBP-type peptidyl-prolyl cis-trans isomerase [Prevotella sp.]|nr:FKBP-type peptidyl-prolyl cis-trans isomerase [Prevotella sp.]MBQ8706089.1 FKBP-type peptidyl-prolyl cis-trans isomerase [Paludibacteraceae bacterium]MBQ9651733.1 FKBP-type peptidyl-prolyl cis-trans isomerase [Prevotella sp.]